MAIGNAVCSLSALWSIWHKIPISAKKIIFSTIYCIWDNANPHEVQQVAMHPQKKFFGTDFGPAATLVYTFFKTSLMRSSL